MESCLNLPDGSESLIADLNAAQVEYSTQRASEFYSDSSESESETEASAEDSEDDWQPFGVEPNPDQPNDINWSECDNTEKQHVAEFLRNGCGCTFGPKGKNCSGCFSMDEICERRNDCFELTSTELDLVILSQLESVTRLSETAHNSRRATVRKRCKSFGFMFQGRSICKKTFLVLHGIGIRRYKNLKNHYRENGLTTRTHGNKGRLPKRTCSFETVSKITQFIHNYAEEHAVLLPGRVPGYKRSDIKLLPSSTSKAQVYRTYCLAAKRAADTDHDPTDLVSESKFVRLWNAFAPNIIIMNPMTDLCNTCQKNNTKIYRSANIPDHEKRENVKEMEKHLLNAERERSFYKEACNESKNNLKPRLDSLDFNSSREPCSFSGKIHYSFDYAQQVHLPSNPMQPGPIYFKVPRKCGIFGVCCEGIPRQVNFLIDESVVSGKGANAVISYLHYFFENFGVGETDVHLNADNCCGQNKNSYLLWYWSWRTIAGLHQSCLYSFLVVGHTKFACDWCFGLLKKVVRKTFISSLFELVTAVDNSTVSGVNVAQLCGLHDGTVIVKVFDWAAFLTPYFRKFPGIKKYSHFRFSSQTPGKMFYKEFSDSEEQEFNLLKNSEILPPITLPPEIKPQGLSRERKDYLFREIREFCKEGTEDLIAPALY